MESDELPSVLDIIATADGHGDYASVFTALPEQAIWVVAPLILDHAEYAGYGLVLLRAIDNTFPRLVDRASLVATIRHVLQFANDSLLFDAALDIVLHHSLEWDESLARQLFTICEARYLGTMTDGDPFIATRALEGAVMLPLLRDDARLLFKSIGLLLTDYPPIPSDPAEPAHLPVRAIKLLGRCYDRRPDHEIADRIRQLTEHPNRATATEARFNLGIVRLYDGLRANEAAAFQEALIDARQQFELAAVAMENRSDAELFSLLAACFLTLATASQPMDITELVRTAAGIFRERLFAFGGAVGGTQAATERALLTLVQIFERWALEIDTFHRQPDMSLAMRELAQLYVALRDVDRGSGLATAAIHNAEPRIMLPLLRGRFVQVQEVTARLQRMLEDPMWSASLSSTERAFYELVLEEVDAAPDPKAAAAIRLDAIRAAAEHDAPQLAERIRAMQARGLPNDEMLIELAVQMLDEQRVAARQLVGDSGPAHELLRELLPALRAKLSWSTADQRWTYLESALKMCARYLVTMFQISWEESRPTNVDFLYAKEVGGMGKDASEGHLEAHFYNIMKFAEMLFPEWQGTVVRQPITSIPGRGDLAFLFPERVLFGLEVKCEPGDPSPATIQHKFLAQAQSYAAGTQGVSIAFILDTSTKMVGIPLRDVKDYCYIDQRLVPNAIHPNFVVVFVFPANRIHPSTHTTGLKKLAATSPTSSRKRGGRKPST